MWTVVYISQSVETAEKLAKVLEENNVISRMRRRAGEDSGCVEILVPSTELEAAQDLIIENELF